MFDRTVDVNGQKLCVVQRLVCCPQLGLDEIHIKISLRGQGSFPAKM
jgi:hypothetical protein